MITYNTVSLRSTGSFLTWATIHRNTINTNYLTKPPRPTQPGHPSMVQWVLATVMATTRDETASCADQKAPLSGLKSGPSQFNVNVAHHSADLGWHNGLTSHCLSVLKGIGLDWVEFNAPPNTVWIISEAVFTANYLTVTDKQTIRKKLNINHKNTYINTIQIKETNQTTKHTAETKLLWFSRLVRHSVRKRGGLILPRPRAPHGDQSFLATDLGLCGNLITLPVRLRTQTEQKIINRHC